MEDISLAYVKGLKTKDENGLYQYDFYFSTTSSLGLVWGEDWDESNPRTCSNLIPRKQSYKEIKRVKTTLPLKTINDITCYTVSHTINGSIALAWINIEKLEDYPENGRMVFHFGDSLDKVNELLAKYNYNFEINE